MNEENGKKLVDQLFEWRHIVSQQTKRLNLIPIMNKSPYEAEHLDVV